MKKAVNILLTVAVILPLTLLFWPFAQWNEIMSLMFRIIPSLAAQMLFCRTGKHVIVEFIPVFATGVLALWGTYLYFTSSHWANATVGGLLSDYVSPFICCFAVFAVCLITKKK